MSTATSGTRAVVVESLISLGNVVIHNSEVTEGLGAEPDSIRAVGKTLGQCPLNSSINGNFEISRPPSSSEILYIETSGRSQFVR